MKLMFVYWAMEDQGSGLVIQGYTAAARALGHEVSVYGRWIPGKNNPVIPLNYSVDIDSADAVVFIFEWTTRMQPGDQLDLARIVSKVPRNRRVVLDGDGKYNDVIKAGDDYNHAYDAEARQWIETCDSVSDKICQPTLHPLRPGVIPFLFYAYNSAWERPLQIPGEKEFDMIYVGHSKFRWSPMLRVLKGVEPVRSRIGRIGLLGYGWDSPPHWARSMQLEHAYFADSGVLKQSGIEFLPPVRFEHVIDAMSRARFNPVLLRSLFCKLSIVTPRIFETLAAGTIPLLVLEPEHVREIYGESALQLLLPDEAPEQKILDIVNCPERYRETVISTRAHLAQHHSHEARLRRLIEIIES
jgi:glycosyltransferase involved in cell wall biosynthesis